MMTMQKVPSRVLAWLAVTVAVGVTAYLIGHGGSSTTTITGPGIAYVTAGSGTAYVGANEPLNKQPVGFAYSISPNISWSDSSGSLHDGGRPSCLPFGKAVRLRNIEAVQFAIPHGGTTGTVVWVQC